MPSTDTSSMNGVASPVFSCLSRFIILCYNVFKFVVLRTDEGKGVVEEVESGRGGTKEG